MELPTTILYFLSGVIPREGWCFLLSSNGELTEIDFISERKAEKEKGLKLWKQLEEMCLFEGFFPMQETFLEIVNLLIEDHFYNLYFINEAKNVFLLVFDNTEDAHFLQRKVQQNNEGELS